MYEANEEMIEWAEGFLYGPGIDSWSRPDALADALEEAETPEQVWVLFNRGWASCDAVSPYTAVGILKVLNAQPDRGTDYLSGDCRAFYDQLPDLITIYRGAPPARRLGMAWTTDFETARQFAIGHRGIRVPGGRVYRTQIVKTDVLSVSQDRDEKEIIIDPATVRDLEMHEKMP